MSQGIIGVAASGLEPPVFHAISALISQQIEDKHSKLMQTMLDSANKERDEQIKKTIKDEAQELVVKMVNSMAKGEFEGILAKNQSFMAGEFQVIKEQMTLLLHERTPYHFYIELEDMKRKHDALRTELLMTLSKMSSVLDTSKVLEITNEEIKELYAKSGLQLKDIAHHFHIAEATAHHWINGRVQNKEQRSAVARFLMDKIKDRVMKDNKHANL